MDAALQQFLCATFACSADTAASICQRAMDRRYPVRAIILKQGDRATATFLLVNGRVHAVSYGPEGQSVLLQEFLPGDFFGAVVETAPNPSHADLIAAEQVRAAAFLIMDFLALAERHGCIGLAVSKMLLRQLQSTAVKMAERSTLSAPGRVCAELLRLARSGNGSSIRPAPVLAALASRVQTSRETVSRTINTLERRGIVQREGKSLAIVAPHRLEEMVV